MSTETQTEQEIEDKDMADPMRKCCVTGVGWCWMQDGEIMEVIATDDDG